MPDKNQVFIFTDAQLSLLKNTFADNDVLLYAIRKVFLQMPVSDQEKALITKAMTAELEEALRVRILPQLSPTAPLGQLQNLMVSLMNDLRSKSIEEMQPLFEAKQIEIDYIEQQFEILRDLKKEPKIKLSELGTLKGKTTEQAYIDMHAYLYLIGYLDSMFTLLKSVAGGKDESPEDQKERMRRDSAK